MGVRKVQAGFLSASGATARHLTARSGSAAILMYHRVLRDDESAVGVEPGMFVRASTFESHICWLKERFSIVALGDLMNAGRAPEDPPVVAVTFDDGWRDNRTVAWPILERYRATATVFLVRDWCAAGTHAGGTFLRPEEIRDLLAAGMEFGAHTATHAQLDRLGDREAELEMQRSKESIEEWTGRPCTLFAYPFGSHNDRTVAIASRLFVGSVVVGGGWWTRASDRARIPRIGIHQDVSSTRSLFEARLATLL
jgi:peptidoglycan/xylan/chitin deacetylase (PgdA/CDA1 family)